MAGYKGSKQKGARPIANAVTGQTVVDGTGGCRESLYPSSRVRSRAQRQEGCLAWSVALGTHHPCALLCVLRIGHHGGCSVFNIALSLASEHTQLLPAQPSPCLDGGN